jgi:hypothetical protein
MAARSAPGARRADLDRREASLIVRERALAERF